MIMKINFTETVLRDANQSLLATSMSMDNMKSILKVIDEAGYYSVECWGGAVFDSCIRFLNEDPWERLVEMKKSMPNTKLQMLLRGQSLLGYKHFPDDVVRKFIYNSVSKGIDIVRIFDALNDINNIKSSVAETLKCGAHPSCALSYTTSPIHTIEKYIDLARQMEDLGAKSICIKDMSGNLTPMIAYELILKLKQSVSVPIILHSHCTTGLAYMTYLKAIEAGVDVIDTAISSLSGGTSQPATEVLAKTVNDMRYEIDLNFDKLNQINEHFRKVRDDYTGKGLLDYNVIFTDPRMLENQIPGGMYSNLIAQLKEQNILHILDDVLEEIPIIRKEWGYPPLVTPISQLVATQATANILAGKRYKVVLAETKGYFNGEYGIPPGEVDLGLIQKLVGKNAVTRLTTNEIKPLYEETKNKYKIKSYGRSDILTTILFPDLADSFIKRRNNKNKYSFRYVCTKADNNNLTIGIEPEDEIKAVLIAILSCELKKPIKDILIKNIYEMEEGS